MTQSRKDALQDLLEHVEAGTASGKFGSMSAYWCADMQVDAMRAYSGSLDAAHDLHEVVLTGWSTEIICRPFSTKPHLWHVRLSTDHTGYGNGMYEGATKENPARAWLISIIKALIAEANASPDPLR